MLFPKNFVIVAIFHYNIPALTKHLNKNYGVNMIHEAGKGNINKRCTE